jgi:hypothetical protein
MPLRDHFRLPVSKRSSWEGFHGLWPGVIVQQLVPLLPDGYVAEPRVHLGTFFEIDVSTFAGDQSQPLTGRENNGGVATAAWAPPAPSLAVDAEVLEQYVYEVLVYDAERDRRLVAAVEIVCPANKDRPDSRQMFVAKCAHLLQNGVCVSIVDLVTVRHFNLYNELLTLLGHSDPAFGPDSPVTYAATCRKRLGDRKPRLETWAHPLVIGHQLGELPLWLTETHAVSLDLEASYTESCRILRIP